MGPSIPVGPLSEREAPNIRVSILGYLFPKVNTEFDSNPLTNRDNTMSSKGEGTFLSISRPI